MKMAHLFYFILVMFLGSIGFASVPACMDKKDRLDFNASQLLNFRDQLDHKFTARAFVRGLLVSVIEDRQNHVHFEADLDLDLNTSDDRIEVIYNTKFGPLPDFSPGMEMIACGDFIIDHYSPFKAVIHWLHISPSGTKHEHGFLIINGQIFGQISKEKSK